MSRDFLRFVLAALIICAGVGSWTAYAIYREDAAQTAVLPKAIACEWEPGTDDAPFAAFGAIAWVLAVHFVIASFGAGLLMWLVASRVSWIVVCVGLLVGVWSSDVSNAWMFPIIAGGTFGAMVNINVYGLVGKRRRHRLAQRA